MDHSNPCRMDGTHSQQAFGGFTPIPRGLDFSPTGCLWHGSFRCFSGPCLPRPLGEPSGCVKTKSMRMNQRQFCQNNGITYQRFHPLPLEFIMHFKPRSSPRGFFLGFRLNPRLQKHRDARFFTAGCVITPLQGCSMAVSAMGLSINLSKFPPLCGVL